MNIGRNALITGGSLGIGFEIGKALMRTNLEKLCLADIVESKLRVKGLRKLYPGKTVMYVKCDVTKKDDLDACYKETLKQFHKLDIVVNDAGIFNDLEAEKTMEVDVCGVINSSLLGMQYMSKENGGNGGYIINIASVAGLGPAYFGPIYTAAKWGVVGFTRCMGYHPYYENKTGVKFITICPGITRTNIYDYLKERVVLKEFTKIIDDQIVHKAVFQNISTIGNCVLEALKVDKNGSIFVCDSNIIKEVELTEFAQEFVFKELRG